VHANIERAITKSAECPSWKSEDRQKSCKAEAVRYVEQAITHMLKRMVVTFLLKRTEEQRPSAAASRIAASLLNSKIAKNTKVSETEISPFTLGIWTVILAPTMTERAVRSRNRRSSSDGLRLAIE
jgi:hypothetical protein